MEEKTNLAVRAEENFDGGRISEEEMRDLMGDALIGVLSFMATVFVILAICL